MFVLIVASVLFAVRSMTALIIRQVVAERATCSTAETSTDSRAGCAAEAIAYERSTCRPDPTPYGGFCPIAFLSTDGSTGGTPQACAYCSARRAAKLLAYDIAKCTTNAASESGCTVSGSHRSLRNQDAQYQGG